MSIEPLPQSEIILYKTEDGGTRVQVRLQDETVRLTQKQMAALFGKDVRTVNEHFQNVFAEGELVADSVIRKFRITAAGATDVVEGAQTEASEATEGLRCLN